MTVAIGIIGCGNMGGAIAAGIQGNATLRETFTLHTYARRQERVAAMEALGAFPAAFPHTLAQAADIIILAVKPYQISAVIQDILPALKEDSKKLVISVAAGVSLADLHVATERSCPVARVMPNTLVAVGKGLFGVSCASDVTQEQLDLIRRLFGAMGDVVEFPEDKMHAFTALAGCGPAYVFHFMESLAEAGVSMGLSRENSLAMARSLLGGCAVLAETSGLHPALLREQVTSPGGATIAGINHMDRTAHRGHTIDAVMAACTKSKAMSGE